MASERAGTYATKWIEVKTNSGAREGAQLAKQAKGQLSIGIPSWSGSPKSGEISSEYNSLVYNTAGGRAGIHIFLCFYQPCRCISGGALGRVPVPVTKYTCVGSFGSMYAVCTI